MTRLVVDIAARTLQTPYGSVPCTLGRNGIVAAADKREGDGCTPLGDWPVRAALFRRDRIAPPPGFALTWRWIDRADGWSDDPADPAYNRPVRHPHTFSAERLWREDGAYDAVLVLGYNDMPVVPGRGSAVFLHCRASDATAGCVAVDRSAIDLLLRGLTRTSALVVASRET